MSIKVQFITRIRLVIIAMAFLGVAVVYKMVKIQVIEKDIWKRKAERAHVRMMDIKATRGNIFACDGSLLATSLPFYKIAFDPSVSKQNKVKEDIYRKNIEAFCDSLARFFGDKSSAQYMEMIRLAKKEGKRYLSINPKQINFADKKNIEKWPLVNVGRIKGGVIFEKIERRFMPFGGLAARTIGKIQLTDKIVKGQFGLEYSFNNQLSGINGKQLFIKIGGGVWKPVSEDFIRDPKQGHDLETTIDVNIQDFAEEALKNVVTQNAADHGCAIVMETATGNIKALVNIDEIISGSDTNYREVYNWALGRNSEPGSTMKLASVMALMEENDEISLDTKVATGNGSYKFFNIQMKDSKEGGYGTISLRDVFKHSSNIGVARLINDNFYHQKQLQQQFINYLEKFHLTNSLEFQMYGAAKPHVKSPDSTSWSGISLPWMSIGYELEMSPMQMLAFYNAVGNDGYYVHPRIVTCVLQDGKILESFDVKKERSRICSEKTLKAVREMLWAVVNEQGGTAYTQRSKQYSISGKTGTKQNLKANKYVHEYYSTFCGFFPSEAPKYSILVAIDNPKKGKYYGADVAAPVFKAIADKIYKNDLKLHKPLDPNFNVVKSHLPVIKSGFYADIQLICNQLKIPVEGGSSELWVKAERDENFVKWKDIIIKEERVPNVVGMTLRDAISLCENQGLKVVFEGRGRVSAQSQESNSLMVMGSTIKLTLK